MKIGSHNISARAFAAVGLFALSSLAVSAVAETLERPAEPSIIPVIDRPEMRSFQPYSGLQYGFRPTPPIQRGVRTKRPKVVMPKRVAPLIGADTPFSAQGYAYCADPPGDFEPRSGPYGSRPIDRRQCP